MEDHEAGQGVHSPGMVVVSPWPMGQSSQRPPERAVEPGRQSVHSPPSTEEKPAEQETHEVRSETEVDPGRHFLHSTAPKPVVMVPGKQGMQGSPLAEKRPGGHSIQVVCSTLGSCPGEQGMQSPPSREM
jgi:hypothetical protein